MSDKLERWRREKKKYCFPILLSPYNPFRPTGTVEIALHQPAMGFRHRLLKSQIKVFRFL